MAWLGSAIGLGVVVGPALGAALSQLDWHVTFRFGHFYANNFSTPFFISGLIGFFALFAAMVRLQELIQIPEPDFVCKARLPEEKFKPDKSSRLIQASFGKLLGMSFLG